MKNDITDLSIFRTEIIESERSQIDFLKWKLILVAAVGSASLGFYESEVVQNAEYLICLIPFICAYVDFVYYHLTLRILVIGAYLRKMNRDYPGSVFLKYEEFAEKARKKNFINSFAFEEWAVIGSSYVLSFLVILFGIIINVQNHSEVSSSFIGEFLSYLLAGIIGFILTTAIVVIFYHKLEAIKSIVTKNYTAESAYQDGARET